MDRFSAVLMGVATMVALGRVEHKEPVNTNRQPKDEKQRAANKRKRKMAAKSRKANRGK
jgi:hypothetical protein